MRVKQKNKLHAVLRATLYLLEAAGILELGKGAQCGTDTTAASPVTLRAWSKCPKASGTSPWTQELLEQKDEKTSSISLPWVEQDSAPLA